MEKLKSIIALAAVVLAAASCGDNQATKGEEPNDDTPNILVLYYSQTSNTKAVAQEIATKLDADIEEIVMEDPYDEDFQATIERCKQDMEQGIVPDIQAVKADLSNYDVVFVGFPVWFGTYAPPVASFLKDADLSGKKIVPFCTFGSGGLESSVEDLAKAEPEAEILPGYGVRAARMEAMPDEVDNFLKANGFVAGDFVRLDDFSELRPVSDVEAAVFDTAVEGYPMIHAKATEVASRSIPDGTEYLFTAVDLPRDDNQHIPAIGEMKVYVTVIEGKRPVFTRVVR